jgi:hypothetical protein
MITNLFEAVSEAQHYHCTKQQTHLELRFPMNWKPKHKLWVAENMVTKNLMNGYSFHFRQFAFADSILRWWTLYLPDLY